MPRTLAKVCGNASPTSSSYYSSFSSCCACSLLLFFQLTVNACQSRSDGQLVIHSAIQPSQRAFTHPGRHSSIHSFGHSLIQHSVSHLASYAVSPPPSEFRTQCSRSLAICLQPGGRASNLMRVASLSLIIIIIHWHPLLAVACCEFNDAAHSTVIKSVWHFNLKAATFHMPHAACNKRAHYKEL